MKHAILLHFDNETVPKRGKRYFAARAHGKQKMKVFHGYAAEICGL